MSLETVRPKQAKAVLKNCETWSARIGAAIQRAIALVGWSNKEAAAKVGRDPAQLARWISGTERPQMDALMAVDELRWPLVQCLAALDDQNEVETTIRRRA